MPHSSSVLAILLAAFALQANAVAQDVVISEFMAINETILEDEDGDTSDWLELFNASDIPVDLAGWTLTDDAGELDKWTFPSVILDPGTSMIVFASDKDRTDPAAPLHTNFKLTSNGEYLGITRPDGTIEHDYFPEYPPQQADISYGLVVDAAIVTHMPLQADVRVMVPQGDEDDGLWMLPEFDDTGWDTCVTGVGYEAGSGYEPYIGCDVQDEMYGIGTSAYIRCTFDWVPGNPGGLPLELHMRYDDGFICWINGIRAAEANAPTDPNWSSDATSTHEDSDAVIPELFILGPETSLLVPGTNTIAIQGLNVGVNSSDFLVLPELTGYEGGYTGEVAYLSVPTPGFINIADGMGVGPVVTSLLHEPTDPQPLEPITVTCTAEGFDAEVAGVQIVHRVDFGPEAKPIEMSPTGAGTWSASLPGAPAGSIIRWYVLAIDVEGDATRSPLFMDPFNAPEYVGVHVSDGTETSIDLVSIFVEDVDAIRNEEGTRAAIVHGGLLYDNIQVRPRGQSSIWWPKQSLKLDFNSGHHIQFLGDGDAQEELNLQSLYSDKASVRRQLAWDVYEWAGVTASAARPVRLHINGEFHSLATYVEQPDKRMLDRVGLDGEGALYKMYNTCDNAWGGVEKKTREEEDHSDLEQLVLGIQEQDHEALRLFLFDNVDLPAVLSYLAATSLIHDNDHIAKNYYLYRDTEGDGEWRFLPWDKDLTLGRNYTLGGGVLNDTMHADIDPLSHPLFGDMEHPKNDGPWNRLIDAIYRVPKIRSMYLRHLRTRMDDILQPTFTPEDERRLELRVNELRSITGSEIALDHAMWEFQWGEPQTVDQAIAILKHEYFEIRRQHLYTTHSGGSGIIPEAQPALPDVQFGNLLSDPPSGDADEEYIEIINHEQTAIDLSGWRLEGDVSFTFDPGTVLLANGNAFVSPNLATFRARSESPTGGQGLLVIGPYGGNLATQPCNSLRLTTPDGIVIDSFCYQPGDVDGNGIVDVQDLLAVISAWGPCEGCPEDLNADGHVNVIDLLAVIAAWS